MKKLEYILNKIEDAKSLDVLTEDEYRVYHRYLIKGDTRFVKIHSKYQKDSTSTIPFEVLDDITPQNYIHRFIPGIKSWGKRTRFSSFEISLLKEMKSREFTHKMIASLLGRNELSIDKILTKLNKSGYTFGTLKTSNQKYTINERFLSSLLGVRTVLDAFCGEKSWWKNNTSLQVLSNDINEDIQADFHEPANYLLHKLQRGGYRFDIVDLDSFSSALQEFDIAIQIATKGIILTFGDRRAYKNHKARKNGVKRIENSIKNKFLLPEYTEDLIIKKLQEQAMEKANKKLVVLEKYSTSGIWRVYFKIEEPDYDDLEGIYQKLVGQINQVSNKMHNLQLSQEESRNNFIKTL